ncbi:MAG TPA: DUF1801 domain-containing protein [Candidatus Thermoplasmatota archaeon]|nr:DUF1801 domain-containing protein [Candidatus Thermoplasmatota archaeon]
MAKTDFQSVDEYIATFPKEVQAVLKTLRKAVREAVPEAEEAISYQMPAFRLHGRPILYFAAFKGHYSLFGVRQDVRDDFRKQLERHEAGKGTLRFPLGEPVPVKLVQAIAKLQAKETLAGEKRGKRASS